MNVADAIPGLVGDFNRFQPLSDRVEGFVDAQVKRFRPKTSDWLVLPWTDGFYLFSEDMEGQRRGREVVSAFLGPSVANIESITDATLAEKLPEAWRATDLVRASSLRLVGGQSNAEKMVARLEDMVAALGGRTRHTLEIKPTPSDLLRDFRLALLRRDDEASRLLLDEIVLTGHVSAENLRYLRLEYLAAFERWAEMRALPYLRTMLQARRPRAVSETLLRMVWWTELVGVENLSPLKAFAERDVMGAYGPLLRSVRVPSTPAGRLVGFLCASVDADKARQEEIIGSAVDDAEQLRLRGLLSDSSPPPAPVAPEIDPLVAAFEMGRYSAVIDSFLAEPSPRYADLAVQAVLESGALEHARNVFTAVSDLDSLGELTLGRRARRDFEDLERLASDTCTGWDDWSLRLADDVRWSDAGPVLRDSAGSWKPIGSLDSKQIDQVCGALLGAVGGPNDDQLRASLDVLCMEAVSQLNRGSANEFCRTILLLLSEQENFSEMVRGAYLDLFAAWLEAGPSPAEYGEVIELTSKIWMRVRSPNAVSWAISILEASADAPCPDSQARLNLAAQLINEIRARYHSGASLRERAEIEDLA
ncbi:MAG: protein DpdD, partial [Actinomycetota bacterium]